MGQPSLSGILRPKKDLPQPMATPDHWEERVMTTPDPLHAMQFRPAPPPQVRGAGPAQLVFPRFGGVVLLDSVPLN